MSNLTNYEISIWEDKFDSDTGQFIEQRVMVIGASDLITQSRALQPFFKRGVNGTNELSFEMYYRYEDSVTGELVENPYVKYLTNETKIKLKKDGKWYDFIIKNIQEDSANKLFKYSATNLHVNELSKNGYSLTLDTELGNNVGTVKELGDKIFSGTGWSVESEKIPQKTEESLVEIKFLNETVLSNTVKLTDADTVAPTPGSKSSLTIPKNSSIYVFYSSLKDGMDRFQFIYVAGDIEKNGDRVIQNKNCQYYIDGVTYSEPTTSGGQANLSKYGLQLPSILKNVSFESSISQEYRCERYVFSKKVLFNSVLNKHVTEYKDGSGNTLHEYTETEYESPVLIKNLISNTDFKSTTGWTGQYVSVFTDGTDKDGNPIRVTETGNKMSTLGTKIQVSSSPDMVKDLLAGSYSDSKKYTPYLRAFFKSPNGILINNGPYQNRKAIENVSAGQKFVLVWRLLHETTENGSYEDRYGPYVATSDFFNYFNVSLAEYNYHVSANCYEIGESIMNFSKDTEVKSFAIKETINGVEESITYYYAIGEINSDYNKNNNEFQASKYQLFIKPTSYFSDIAGIVLDIVDMQLYEHIPTELTTAQTTPFLRPDSQPTETKIITKYSYFNPKSTVNTNATSKDDMDIETLTEKKKDLQQIYVDNAEKSVTLSVKQSNYFNAAQSLSETAQCWVDFCVEHDDDGNITSKKVIFKNYIGKNNYAGFRYGVNLKGIQRNNDSKAIVTKLIVQENPNEFANNGFCTIARAKSNEVGETHIYDFNHYIRQKQLNYYDLWNVLYNIDQGLGEDLENDENKTKFNIYGYYPRIQRLNQQIDSLSEKLLSHSTSLLQAKADLQVATSGQQKASDQYETAAIDFLKITGCEYKNIPADKRNLIQKSSESFKALEAVATYETAYKNFVEQKSEAEKQVAAYEKLQKDYTEEIDILKKQKEKLYNTFESTYRRFIQEGTWSKPEYIDDEQYYLDAKSVACTSASPQVSYTISVMDLSGVEEYKDFKFELADRTFMEDEEFFGYGEDGSPYREEVVLTEIGYYLDEPDRTTIKVQNFKNQFQDLFQRITATTQAVSYSSGAWENAGNFMQASAQQQAEFLTNALNNAETVLQNAGEQSVTLDKEGLTITDLSSPDQKIRMVGGAIMLGGIDDNGQEQWMIGMTAAGINAKTITTGRLNTGEVMIMNGSHPSFRWDAKGITAFDFTQTNVDGQEVAFDYNTNKFVRFDRYGIYGIDGAVDGTNWNPNNISDINSNATFALTWEGLKVTDKSGGIALIGKQNNYIMIVKDKNNKDTFRIKSDGGIEIGGDLFIGTLEEANKVSNKITNAQNTANSAQTTATNAQSTASSAQSAASSAQTTATNAQSAATKAQNTANSAQSIANSAQSAATKAQQDLLTKLDMTNSTQGEFQYAWSKTDGLRMWDKTRDDNGLIFAITKQTDNSYALQLKGNITATGGNIAGWNIGPKSLSKYSTSKVTIGGVEYYQNSFGMRIDAEADGNALAIGSLNENSWHQANFRVTGSGKMYATGAEISGKITANSGTIAGWEIKDKSLYNTSTNNDYYGILSSTTSNSICFFAGAKDEIGTNAKFWVNNAGTIKATAGFVGNWKIQDDNLYATYSGKLGEDTDHPMNLDQEVTLTPSGITLSTHYWTNKNPIIDESWQKTVTWTEVVSAVAGASSTLFTI